MVASLRRKVRSKVMVCSSCKLTWRRWCYHGRMRSCLVIIFLVSLTLWMLTATQSDQQKVGVNVKDHLPIQSKGSDSSIARTKGPVHSFKEGEEPNPRAGKRLHGAEEADQLPLYKTLPKEAKETGDAISGVP